MSAANLTMNRMRRHFYEFRRLWQRMDLPPRLSWFIGRDTLRDFREESSWSGDDVMMLANIRGGDMGEWPLDLRVREFPGAPEAREGAPQPEDTP